MKPIVLLDMDGVLVHKNQVLLDQLNEKYGTEFEKHDILDFHYNFMSHAQKNYMYHLWNQPDIYDDYELAQEDMLALDALRSFARVMVCTAPLEGHIQGKYSWARRYFGKNDIVLTHDKAMVRGDILVDDAIHNLEAFPGKAITFTQPWNLHYDSIQRVDKLSQIPLVAKELLS